MTQMYKPLMGRDSGLEPELWLVVGKGCVFHSEPDQWLWTDNRLFKDSDQVVIGYFDDKPVAVTYQKDIPSADQTPLRSILSLQHEGLTLLLSHGLQILTAERDHRFCGRCGSRCDGKAGEWAMVCNRCSAHYYPRISPCIIVLVHRGDEVLLVMHNRHVRDNPVFTTVAGFIEPGESAEEGVIREVMEETGIKVKNPEYRFSQNWPFPHSLMLGFHAEYESGDILLDSKELSDGDWFHIDNLPDIPPGFTIARKLINYFIQS
ncbi:NAD(+) diphosphatase [Endozoicomonas montiporae]|uniref:NAD(+) diphosphatase n=1 Tax=Endozoicomonas montiporae CL-33 TaxID=570277 RepID=A0A142BD33_9GAMM|nr:NAD(+) diphosphatase [Endozoicomonas montiporae]AMO56659.1 NADH pyrophosphatase [Endozoicomonas montiporae CL-33]